MSIADQIRKKLTKALNPQVFELYDESDRHRGHAGHDGRGESHFQLVVVSDSFNNLSQVERHRMIYDLLDEEIKTRVHALSIKAWTPEERKSKG